MVVGGVEETLSNLEIAHRQIERAIVIFLDDKDYVSALTLAGAAEEVLGKLLNKEEKEHWLDSISKEALQALGFRKEEAQSQEATRVKKEIANSVNQHKNRFKHYSQDEEVALLVDEAAAKMISRAISNYFELTQRKTGAMGKFNELVIGMKPPIPSPKRDG